MRHHWISSAEVWVARAESRVPRRWDPGRPAAWPARVPTVEIFWSLSFCLSGSCPPDYQAC